MRTSKNFSKDMLSLLAVLTVLTGCQDDDAFDEPRYLKDDDCLLPPQGSISSLAALTKARCVIANAPESELVLMQTSPGYNVAPDGSTDGLAQWRFHFAEIDDPATVHVVDVSPAGMFAQVGTYPPCPTFITPFDSVALADHIAPLLPTGFLGTRLYIDKHSSCPPFSDLGGLTDAFVRQDDGPYHYLHFLFNDTGDLIETCEPCQEYSAISCDCKVL